METEDGTGEKRNESPGLHKTSIYFVGFVAWPCRDVTNFRSCVHATIFDAFDVSPPSTAERTLASPTPFLALREKERLRKNSEGDTLLSGKRVVDYRSLFFILNFKNRSIRFDYI